MTRHRTDLVAAALDQAFADRFTDHHAFLLAEMIAPFGQAAARLDEVTGISAPRLDGQPRTAQLAADRTQQAELVCRATPPDTFWYAAVQ